MLGKGLVSPKRIAENDSLMTKIANREPVERDGLKIVFDEKLVQTALDNIQPACAAVDGLFTRP